MYLDGSWFSVVDPDGKTEGAKVTADDVKVIPFPSYTESENEPGTILSGFSSGWYISKKCWNDEAKRKAAIDFVKYNSSDEAIVKFVEAGGGFAASDTAKMDESKMTAQQKQFLQLLKDAPATPMVAQDNLERRPLRCIWPTPLSWPRARPRRGGAQRAGQKQQITRRRLRRGGMRPARRRARPDGGSTAFPYILCLGRIGGFL